MRWSVRVRAQNLIQTFLRTDGPFSASLTFLGRQKHSAGGTKSSRTHVATVHPHTPPFLNPFQGLLYRYPRRNNAPGWPLDQPGCVLTRRWWHRSTLQVGGTLVARQIILVRGLPGGGAKFLLNLERNLVVDAIRMYRRRWFVYRRHCRGPGAVCFGGSVLGSAPRAPGVGRSGGTLPRSTQLYPEKKIHQKFEWTIKTTFRDIFLSCI